MAPLDYSLIKTTRRLTFDIHSQRPDTIYKGEDDGDYFRFVADNGYEVISRSRMDIQTERLWLLGAKYKEESRSGTMVFSSDEKRDIAFDRFTDALNQWAKKHGGEAVNWYGEYCGYCYGSGHVTTPTGEWRGPCTCMHATKPKEPIIKELEECASFIHRIGYETGYCCCGTEMGAHTYHDGHTPVDEGWYVCHGRIESINKTLSAYNRKGVGA